MNHKYSKCLIVFIISLFHYNYSHSQCTVSSLIINGGYGTNVGQSFTASCNGTLTELSVNIHPSTVSTTGDLDIRDSNCDIIWTVPGINIISNSIITIDLTTGSGSTLNVTNGLMYSFHFYNLNGTTVFRGTSASGTGGGCLLNSGSCSCISSADLWFEIEIDAIAPVTWNSFNASYNESTEKVDLEFSVLNQPNNDFFEIEHSVDGRKFEKIK